MIQVTPDAVQHLRTLLAESPGGETRGLRLAVDRGGCAGWQYSMKLDEPAQGDTVVEEGGVRIIIGPESEPLLRGVRLDFKDDLNDAGFRVENPNAVRSCGCGTSFEPVSPSSPASTPETSHSS
jgi:iron-sulfur cluster assembly accessory protein